MNVWMKRGLRTALLTGGLLAAGTGIASADDGTVDVTVAVTVTDSAPAGIETPTLSGLVAADLGDLSTSLGGHPTDASGPAASGPADSTADVDVPVTVTGNAVALLGDASAGGAAPAQHGADDGNAGLVDADVPVLVCGNGIGVLGNADATCSTSGASQGSGTDDAAVDVEAPVSVCGVAVGALGDAGGGCAPPAGASSDGAGTVHSDAPVTVSGIGIGSSGDAGASRSRPVAPSSPPGAVHDAVHRLDCGVVPAAASTSSGGGLATGGAGSGLAFTGATLTPALLGLVAVASGLGLMLLGRRRAAGLG